MNDILPITDHPLAVAGARPLVVIVDDGGAGMRAIARRLAGCAVALVRAGRETPAAGADVLLVPLSAASPSLAALEWALASWPALGRPELVFVMSDLRAEPLARGLSAAGVRYVVSEAEAADWLLEHAPALAAYSRARRALLEATDRLPHRLALVQGPEEEPVGLFHAEQQFRTSYIQMLLARSGSRREAALKARIAYRTFCHILEKLGISSRRVRGQGASAAGEEADPPHRMAR